MILVFSIRILPMDIRMMLFGIIQELKYENVPKMILAGNRIRLIFIMKSWETLEQYCVLIWIKNFINFKELILIIFKAIKHHISLYRYKDVTRMKWIDWIFQCNVHRTLISIIFHLILVFTFTHYRNKLISPSIKESQFLKSLMKYKASQILIM
jgi:hypothetical protein